MPDSDDEEKDDTERKRGGRSKDPTTIEASPEPKRPRSKDDRDDEHR